MQVDIILYYFTKRMHADIIYIISLRDCRQLSFYISFTKRMQVNVDHFTKKMQVGIILYHFTMRMQVDIISPRESSYILHPSRPIKCHIGLA